MKTLFLGIAMLATFPICAENQAALIEKNSFTDYEKTFLLPINHTQKPFYTLMVTIPKGYKSLQSLEEFGESNGMIIEYIPQEDTDHSEIITLNKFVGKRIQAINFIEILKQQLLANSKDGTILSKSSFRKKSIEQSHFIMQYIHQNQQEVIGASYFSGPYDSAGVQYTIRLKRNQSINEAIKKIETFFKNHVKLTK